MVLVITEWATLSKLDGFDKEIQYNQWSPSYQGMSLKHHGIVSITVFG